MGILSHTILPKKTLTPSGPSAFVAEDLIKTRDVVPLPEQAGNGLTRISAITEVSYPLVTDQAASTELA